MPNIIKHIEYDYNSYSEIMRNLSEEYKFLHMFSVGKSVFGRDIMALRLGRSADNIVYAAAIHGSERITATVLLRFIAELCEAVSAGGKICDVDARRALYGRSVIFIPLCNPDGCEISLKGAAGCGAHAARIYKLCGGDFEHWNSNLRGVDLNHNFDAGWEKLRELERKQGFFGPGPTRYGGSRPFSEPETAALAELCRTVNVRYLLTFHTQGEVIYWDYDGIETPRGKKMAEIFSASSGYALDVPTGLSYGGGFKDWFIKEFHRPGFTVELGNGKNPLSAEKGAEIYERVKEMLVLGLLM